MTNEEALTMWHEEYLPDIHTTYEQRYNIDVPARNESFNNFTDMLCKDGQITDEQYDSICLPDAYDNEYHPRLSDALCDI